MTTTATSPEPTPAPDTATTTNSPPPSRMQVYDPALSRHVRDGIRLETNAEMERRIRENHGTFAAYEVERATYPLAPDAFADLFRAAEHFPPGTAPNSDTARLVIRTLVTLAPPLRKAGNRRLAFDGACWSEDRAADRAAGWIAPACRALLRQHHPTFLHRDGTWGAPTDPMAYTLEPLPHGGPVEAQLERWVAAPQQAVDALYRALPDLGSEALREDPVDLLNTPAGVISLRDGRYLDPDPEPPVEGEGEDGEAAPWRPTPTRDFVRCTSVAPAETVSQVWLDFLADALPDPHTRDWLQRLCGYFATGRYDEDINVWLLGVTRAGKTTFSVALGAVFGSYATRHDSTALLRSQTRPLKLTDAERGLRLLRMTEMEERYRVDAARLKELSGGDATTGDWLPQLTALIDSNHPPEFEDHSGGTGERMRVIPFEHYRRPKDRDKSLRHRLCTTEAPGVLRWVIEGAVRYFADDLLDVPDAVREATEAVLAAQDPEGTFYSQLRACATAVPFTTLYQALVARCTLANKPVPGKNLVSARMAAKGFTPVAGAHNQRVVYARLASDADAHAREGDDEDEREGDEEAA